MKLSRRNHTMKKTLKRSMIAFLTSLALIVVTYVPAFAVDVDNDQETSRILWEESTVEAGVSLNTSVAYNEISDEYTIVVESPNYKMVTIRSGDDVNTKTYQKVESINTISDDRSLEDNLILMYENSFTLKDDSNAPIPFSRATYTSLYLSNDKYSYYDTLNTWHLYVGSGYVYSGDSPTSAILTHCKNFKTNIRKMDAEGTAVGEALISANPAASIAYSIRDVVQAFGENGFGSGVKELVATGLKNAVYVVFPHLSTGISLGEAVGHGINMYNAHEAYVFAFNGVKKLT